MAVSVRQCISDDRGTAWQAGRGSGKRRSDVFGMGASLSRHFSSQDMQIIPFPSSLSLAASCMAWALQEVRKVSVHGRPFELLAPHVLPGEKILVLSNDGTTPAKAAELLNGKGFGQSRLTVLEHLGGPKEKRISGTAEEWSQENCADLNVLAIECIAAPDAVIFHLPVDCPMPLLRMTVSSPNVIFAL